MEDTQSVSQKECGNVFQSSCGISCRGIQSSETAGREDRVSSGVSGSLSVQKLGVLSGPPLFLTLWPRFSAQLARLSVSYWFFSLLPFHPNPWKVGLTGPTHLTGSSGGPSKTGAQHEVLNRSSTNHSTLLLILTRPGHTRKG